MTERKPFSLHSILVPQDTNNPFDLFNQSRNLPIRKPEVRPFQINEYNPTYTFNYDYGYFQESKKKREKYIKTHVQLVENPSMQVEQLIYRSSQLTPSNFVFKIDIINGNKNSTLIKADYNKGKLNSSTFSSYPYIVRNQDNVVIAEVNSPSDNEIGYLTMKEVLDQGEEYLEVSHQEVWGRYSAVIPTVLNPEVVTYLFDYFNAKRLPTLDEQHEKIVTPGCLDFYVELSSFN